MMKKLFWSVVIVFCMMGFPGFVVHGAVMTFNSSVPGDNETTRNAWLAAVGISAPAYLVDFETGFTHKQDLNGASFAGGMVVTRDDDGYCRAYNGSVAGSDPIGGWSLNSTESPYLILSFSSGIDYLAFYDIDHTSRSDAVTLIFDDDSTATLALEAAGNAEFFGILRNDMPKIKEVKLCASGDGSWAIDNIQYGPIASSVPLPPSALLLVPGLLGLVVMRRRFK